MYYYRNLLRFLYRESETSKSTCFAPFFVSFLSVMKEMKAPCRVKPCIKKYLLDVFFGGLEKKPYLCRLNVLVC